MVGRIKRKQGLVNGDLLNRSCIKSTVINVNGRDVTISIMLGDITALQVDSIVNAAHEMLMGGGGVDGAIHRAAGPSLLRECMEIPLNDKGVRCNVGEAHITKSYNLPCKHIIHTVAPKFIGGIIRREVEGKFVPVYKNAKPERDEELKSCYINCIELADKNNIGKIAFPSLGCGGHAYPIELASQLAIKGSIEALGYSKNVNEVIFICFSQKDYDIYDGNINEIIK